MEPEKYYYVVAFTYSLNGENRKCTSISDCGTNKEKAHYEADALRTYQQWRSDSIKKDIEVIESGYKMDMSHSWTTIMEQLGIIDLRKKN